MLNTIINICAHTFPFAAKINDVIPMHAAIKVSKSTSSVSILETITANKEPIHNPHSFLVKFLIGLFIVISFTNEPNNFFFSKSESTVYSLSKCKMQDSVKFLLTISHILAIILIKEWVFNRMCYLLTARRDARFFFYIYKR